ncbi:addiction module protein [Microvenator marinus]|uniref:Addiction module protein n=1 Tax=Microvenator marinus TaxID=2600177 RepID=A0A5B8XY13_9DELT|nr:addiction module protein [Microvenator marinus]QED28309.1 addiction module protein [Microvenator marinus]
MADTETLESSVLSLSAKERGQLLVSLIRSLEEDDHARSWSDEIQRRLEEYRRNPSQVIDRHELIASLRNRARG